MYVVLVNPKAGNNQGVKQWRKLEQVFISKNIAYRAFVTSSEQETREIVWECKEKKSLTAFLVVGGDGTVHTVIQDLAGSNIPIALLPAGSGNDLARALKLTNNPNKLAEALLKLEIRELDVLHVNGNYCLTIAAVGMDAAVTDHAARSFYKRWLNVLRVGALTYVLSALLVIPRYKPFHVEIRIDDDQYITEKVWMVACGNTQSYGGGMMVCPFAHPIDGIIDLVFLHTVNRRTIIGKLLPKVYSGKHINKEGVTYLKGRNIHISSDRPLKVIADGEIIGETPVAIRVKEKAIKFIVT
ncbi:diacylglycerol kinase family protein [Bacillus sp. REN10]|uniref:diacylglycerol/lipid kinase family protein n=1 Tax=Bacillus sp. REN10 TaxID=2782541 RepID=UPI00193B6AAF|nr:diacylglycerol kinase family protein [Bacillus sp. REN10]